MILSFYAQELIQQKTQQNSDHSVGRISFARISTIVFYPKIDHYRILHQRYELYGGMTDDLKDSELYKDLQSGKPICFLGDSITFGATTNGVPWYQPMVPYIKGKVFNYSTSGWQVKDLINNIDNIPVADIYIIFTCFSFIIKNYKLNNKII